MAIGGVDTQAGTQLSALRNAQTSRTEDARAQQEAQDARFISSGATETESRESRFGTTETGTEQSGFGSPTTTLDSQSLSALILTTQQQAGPQGQSPAQGEEQNDAQSAAADETRQQQVVAGNSTNSLAPGTTAGVANGSTDTRGVSLLV